MAAHALAGLRRIGLAFAIAYAGASACQVVVVVIDGEVVQFPTATYDDKYDTVIVTGTRVLGEGPDAQRMYSAPFVAPSQYNVVTRLTEAGVEIVAGDKTLRRIPWEAFTKVAVPSAAPTAPRAKVAPAAIAVTNDADVFDRSCDGRFAVVAGANSATPVASVDLVAARQVFALAIPGRLARAVSIGDDGRTVLVVLDAPTTTTANAVRRLTLEADGTLTDSGQELAFGSEYVTKVRVAPGSKVGVALVGTPTRIVSFSLPGLVPRGSVSLTGGTGSALDVNPAGDKVYARSGRRGIAPDVIEGFGFDSATGAIEQTAAPRIANLSAFLGVVYYDPMAISTDGARIVAAEEIATGGSPVPRIASFDARTGTLVHSFSHPQIEQPRTVATLRPCRIAPATSIALEYYHAVFDHYFITWVADEIAKLDAGNVIKGWTRTGKSIPVYTAAQGGSSPVCRYYIPPAAGDSHFFGRGTVECDATGQKNPTFTLEDAAFMHMILPTAGVCPAGTTNVYRVFSNRPDANHRYTTDKAVRDEMVGRGWLAEGDGTDLVAMCAPG